MSEVSLEAESGRTSAENPQMESEETDKAEESLSEDERQESVDDSRGKACTDEVLYDIPIDSGEENAEKSDEDIQKEYVVTPRDADAALQSVSVDTGGHETNHHGETAEAPEEGGDSDTETKVIFVFQL